jgi:predicted DNA-binding protein
MITIELPASLEKRLEAAAKQTGRTARELVIEAVVERIEDIEDSFIGLQRLKDDDGTRIPLEDVIRELEAREAKERRAKPAAE